MIFYISNDISDAFQSQFICRVVIRYNPDREKADQMCKNLQDDPFSFHKIRRDILDIEPGKLFHLFANGKIFRKLFIGDLVRNAVYLIHIKIRKILFHIFS